MTDSFEERRKAAEERYFQEQERKALKKLTEIPGSDKSRLSPITGKAMEQITIQGIVINRCVDSGGIFLAAGEIEAIVKASKTENWIETFFKNLL